MTANNQSNFITDEVLSVFSKYAKDTIMVNQDYFTPIFEDLFKNKDVILYGTKPQLAAEDVIKINQIIKANFFSYDALNDLSNELHSRGKITSKAMTLCQSVTITETDTRLLRMLCQKFKDETLGKSVGDISNHILRVLDFLGTARTAHWLMFSASVLGEL